MFASIRRHQHWIWYVVVFIIIISFVVFFSPNARLRNPREAGNYGTISGRAITEEEFVKAARESQLIYYLRFQEWPSAQSREMGFDVEQETYRRIVLDQTLKEREIRAGPEAVAAMIKRIFVGSSDRPFSQEMYQGFVKNALEPHHLTSEDLHRLAGHEIGREQLMSVYGLTGKLISPQEGEFLYRLQHQPLSVQAAYFSASNYLSAVQVTPALLQQFYTNHMAEYRLPDRRQVSYIRYETTNFLAEADQQVGKMTNFNAMVDQEYVKRGTNYYKDKQGNPLPAPEAKSRIKEEQREQLALLYARKRAADFLNELFQGHEEKNPVRPEDFEKMAAAKQMPVKVTSPFDEREGPAELAIPATFRKAAFELSNENPVYSRPVAGEDAVYVIAIKNRIPSQLQSFDTVKEKLTKDYQYVEGLKLARVAGERFQNAATNSPGKSFEEIAKEQKVSLLSLPPFSLATRELPELGDRMSLGMLQQVANRLSPKQTSRFIPLTEGGAVIHLRDRLPVDPALMKTELAAFLEQKREERQVAAYSEWLQKESQRLKLNMPPRTADR